LSKSQPFSSEPSPQSSSKSVRSKRERERALETCQHFAINASPQHTAQECGVNAHQVGTLEVGRRIAHLISGGGQSRFTIVNAQIVNRVKLGWILRARSRGESDAERVGHSSDGQKHRVQAQLVQLLKSTLPNYGSSAKIDQIQVDSQSARRSKEAIVDGFS